MATGRRPGDGKARPRDARLALFVLLASVPIASVLAQPQRVQESSEEWFDPSTCVDERVLSGIRGAGHPIPVTGVAPVLVPRVKISVILWDEQSKFPPSPPSAPTQKLTAASQKPK